MVTTQRLFGADRCETAAAIARTTFQTGSRTAIIATGRDFPDALAASALAGQERAPVLLTQPDVLPAATGAELTRLNATNLLLLGGTNAVSANVEDALRTPGRTVTRIAGDTRYQTAVEVARRIGATNIGTVNGLRTAFLATGVQFADALAAGPGAFARALPVLLTEPDRLRPETEVAIRELGIQQLIIVGGPAAVSANTETAVRGGATVRNVLRFGGANRQETAALIGQFFLNQNADFPAFDGVEISLARGDDFADALVGAVHAGTIGAPIILAQGPTVLGTATANFLSANFATVTALVVYGGPAAISDAVVQQAQQAAQTPPAPANQVTVTPTEAATLAQGNARQYQATVRNPEGTPFTGQVIIRLLDVPANGATPTALASATPTAGGQPAVFIESVNGTLTATTTAGTLPVQVTAVAGTSGQVTFVVRDNPADPTASDAIPQVVLDLNGNGVVDQGEPAALGGAVFFAATPPAEAGAGQFTNVTVTSVTAAGNAFTGTGTPTAGATPTAGTFTFEFDQNDIFQGGANVTDVTTFRQQLNVGDVLNITYNPDPAGQSTFTFVTNLANAPLTVTSPVTGQRVDQQTFAITGTGQPGFTVTAHRDQNPGGLAGNNVFEPAFDPQVGQATVGPDGTYSVTVPLIQGTATQPAANEFLVVQRAAGATANPTGAAAQATENPDPSLDVEDVPTILEQPAAGLTIANATAVNGGGGGASQLGFLDPGDTITLQFNQPITAPTAGATIGLRDLDGTTATLTLGADPTSPVSFTVPAPNTVVLRVNQFVTGTPGAGTLTNTTINGTQAQITSLSGFATTTGQAATPAGDILIEGF